MSTTAVYRNARAARKQSRSANQNHRRVLRRRRLAEAIGLAFALCAAGPAAAAPVTFECPNVGTLSILNGESRSPDSFPCDNTVTGTINVQYGGTLGLYTGNWLNNYGMLNNNVGGNVISEGVLHNQSGGILNNAGLLSSNKLFSNRSGATLNNSGDLAILGRGQGLDPTNYGRLNNTGYLKIVNPGTPLENKNGGILDNSSSLRIYNGAQLNNRASSTLNNTGSLLVEGRNSSPLRDTALNNYTFAMLTNDGYIRANNGATLYNQQHGKIVNNGNGRIRIEATGISDSGGTLKNEGTLDNNGTIATGTRSTLNNMYFGVIKNNSAGNLTVEPSGVLRNGFILNNYGGTLLNQGSLTITTSGKLYNQLGATLSNGGSLTNDGVLINSTTNFLNANKLVNNPGAFILGTGSFTHTGGGAVTTNNGYFRQGLFDIQFGTAKGNGHWEGAVKVGPFGTWASGNSVGSSTVQGDFDCNGCTIEIEVAGLGAGQFDTLNITGSATFSNNAVFHFIFDDFLPHSGDQFDFLFANLINGLDQVHFTYSGLGDGFDFRVHPESGGLQFVALNDATRQVPVPGTPLLLGMGLPLALWGARRRYQRPVKIESATP